ncbi:hypothetical protein RFI_39479 [Reticulomyxa filosa]|uniref:Uncharacterized protein n=1 Tax=Reticulomyxa filosa TaxID=46433 RepID=X6LBD7_RETFI|nr:hypothetical protein RFI_39479 [Reticulomyxa filosa]|eukprot:ETN98044.1 hypothetical protein RFI_39479 [Reticulomyxa filosa]
MYMHNQTSLLAIITTDGQCLVAQALSAFREIESPILQQEESKSFYSDVLCGDLKAFREKKNKAPFVTVFFSQNECVGKSHVITEMVKSLQLKEGHFVHIPINTPVLDTDFVVDRFASAPVTDDLMVFHINISTQAGKDVNTMMFQLLVLRYLTKSNGESFSVRKNHAFLVELPTQLSTTHKKTRLEDVFKWFYFFGDRIKELAIPSTEVFDELRDVRPKFAQFLKNELQLSPKEHFVLQYLDALDKGQLKNTQNPKDDWTYTTHPQIDRARMLQLINKYAPRAEHSLVQLKSFLQFMYRQLVQVYNFLTSKTKTSPSQSQSTAHCPFARNDRQLAGAIREHIACDMYQRLDEDKADEDEKYVVDESRGDEEFFLVKVWKKADPPMVLLNQIPISESIQVHMHKTTLVQDLQLTQMDNSLSLLSMNLDKNLHAHAQEWRLLRRLYKWDLYNFEEDLIKKQNSVKQVGVYQEDMTDQAKKLHLLLQICGGFKFNRPFLLFSKKNILSK